MWLSPLAKSLSREPQKSIFQSDIVFRFTKLVDLKSELPPVPVQGSDPSISQLFVDLSFPVLSALLPDIFYLQHFNHA